MRLRHGLIALAAVLAQTCNTQIVTAQTVTRAEVDSIKHIVGDPARVFTRNEPCPYSLPNGENDVLCRQRKLNFVIDGLVEDNANLKTANIELSNKIDALLIRIVALESKPLPPPSGNVQYSGGDLTVTGNLTVLGQSSFGGPMKPGVGSAIQMHGRGSAEIIGFSNEAGLDAQNPSYVHCGVFSVSNDAGVRMVKGAYWGDNGRVYCDPNRPMAIHAFDSMGDWSISYASSPDAVEPGQMLVLRQYPELKKAVLTSMRPAPWQLCLGASNALNDFSKLYCPSYGAFGVARGRAAQRPMTQAELFGHNERR